jgi:hypothetical protein
MCPDCPSIKLLKREDLSRIVFSRQTANKQISDFQRCGSVFRIEMASSIEVAHAVNAWPIAREFGLK